MVDNTYVKHYPGSETIIVRVE